MRVRIIIPFVVAAFGMVPKSLESRLEEFEIRDHPDFSIVKKK